MKTHEVFNQFAELTNYNLFETDAIMFDYFQQFSDNSWSQQLHKIGAELGTSEMFHQAHLANKITPVLKIFDARGNRIDFLEFHPSWHLFMQFAKESGVISAPFETDKKGRWSFAAAAFILQSQVEAGAMCPATMTEACISVLQKEENLWKEIGEKLLSRAYDERDIPISEKKSIWIGMGMTEKQGGSDVRSNTTTAKPMNKNGRGEAYFIRGHKWFYSAPMSDAHLVIAKIENTETIGCFFVPRWKPDGSKNEIQIQRLKEKVGNKSNSSSEVEFVDAYGILIGEEGRGIPTIIEMATNTRLNCVLGSTGMIRQATVQAIAYTRQRKAFGKTLYEQALMRSVLVDFALESEAATYISLHLADAFEQSETSETAKAWKRIVTPAAKFWVCKRAVEMSAEAMEVFGGNGYVEESILSRIFKEAPVNSIWEGSGNVMCLDVLRAFSKEKELVDLLMKDLLQRANGNDFLENEMKKMIQFIVQNVASLEEKARFITERLIVITQAILLHQFAPSFVTEAFIATRLNNESGRIFGSFSASIESQEAILQRAFPA